ncbi:MAG: NADH-quinone oxidoreductase subunit M [Chloroflexi bacterium]|nr:NADH-quinone oxidoreductase subunit M [Chloroflexota bacterium]
MPWLSLAIFLPLVGALGVLLAPVRMARWLALGTSGVVLLLSGGLFAALERGRPGFQFEEHAAWVPSLGATYRLGVDGISLPLIVLTAFLTLLAVVYSWNVVDRARPYFALFLVLETGLIGTFSVLDLLLFYVFFEISLVPMYFIIGIWGHENRRYAALKFFLYTRVGSLAMLLSILALYLGTSPRTFDLPSIVAAQPYPGTGLAPSLILLGFFLAFAIKLPSFPFHSWLPDAHVEAPTAGSVLLAGVLLKLGGYGLIRLALPTVPGAFERWALPIAILAVVSAIYGAAVALAQPNLKRMVAFSSINHMGYVLLGIASAAVLGASPEARAAALNGAVVQMVAHGLITGALFFLVGMLYDRAHSYEIAKFSGLWARLPIYGSLVAFMFFGSLGLPGLAQFVGEFQVFLGTLGVFPALAILALLGVVLTTAMFLRTLQRMFFGDSAEGSTGFKDLDRREVWTLAPLVLAVLVLGVLPGGLLSAIDGVSTALVRAMPLPGR